MADKKKTKKQTAKSALIDTFVSVVMPADSTVSAIETYITEVSGILKATYVNYEIVIVDNGLEFSQIDAITNLLKKLPCIRLLRLSRSYIRDAAVFAGLETAIGDFVCVVDPVIDPPTVIPEMIARNRKGNDIIQGVSDISIDGNLAARLGRRLFYWYNRRFLSIDIPLNATYLVSFNRRAINALTNTSRNHRYLRQLARHIGFKLDILTYTPVQNPRNDRQLRTGFLEALEIVTSYSAHPLRFVTWLGVAASIANLAYAIYVVGVKLFGDTVAAGWTTLSLQASAMFFLLFIILVILAEYIGRILTESRQEPSYLVMEELTSTVAIADQDRRNITT